MDQVVQSMVAAAAGTGAPTNPNSRYYGAAVEFFTCANGVQVAYLQRRIIPQAEHLHVAAKLCRERRGPAG